MGAKQSLPTRPMVTGVVQTVPCSSSGRGGKNLVHCMILERPKFRFCCHLLALGPGTSYKCSF